MADQDVLYGLAGAIISSLVGVVIYLYKGKESLQDKRLNDQIEFKDKLNAPLQKSAELAEKQIEMTQRIYDALLSSKRGK